MARTARWLGWTLVVSGAVVLLYVVYLLWFTGLETQRQQEELAENFPGMALTVQHPDGDGGDVEAPELASGGDAEWEGLDEASAAADDLPDPGEAHAALWFERDGERIVNDDVLYVVGDVTVPMLRAGPGRYPHSDVPGGPGNFAVAGHRTTYGSPFWALDELQEGDTIHVVDRGGTEWVYAYADELVVSPRNAWVIGDDPLETGDPTITLTTCHPRGSAAQRLIVFGELVEP